MTAGTPRHRRPAAFRVEEATVEAEDHYVHAGAPEIAGMPAVTAPRPARRRGIPWGRLFFAAAGLLASLAIGVAISDLILALFAAEGWLGWIGLGLAALTGLAFLGFVLRELAGLAGIRRLRRIREHAEAAIPTDAGARQVVAELGHLYAGRRELSTARAELARHQAEVIDPADRLLIAERNYMPLLDAEARRIIGDAVKRISVVTAVSPSATIDLGFVLVVHLGLIRRLAELYGGRPGMLGLLRLARMVVTHLAVTGTIALGDDLIEQIVGHGLAARVSARLGEGVLNGLLAARVGLAALDLTRPLPFKALRRPRIGDFIAAARAGQPREPATEPDPRR